MDPIRLAHSTAHARSPSQPSSPRLPSFSSTVGFKSYGPQASIPVHLITYRFVISPSSDLNPAADILCISAVRLKSDAAASSSSFPFFLPRPFLFRARPPLPRFKELQCALKSGRVTLIDARIHYHDSLRLRNGLHYPFKCFKLPIPLRRYHADLLERYAAPATPAPYKRSLRERPLHRNTESPPVALLPRRSARISSSLSGGRASFFFKSGASVDAASSPPPPSSSPCYCEAGGSTRIAGGLRDRLLRRRPYFTAANPRRRRPSGHARTLQR